MDCEIVPKLRLPGSVYFQKLELFLSASIRVTEIPLGTVPGGNMTIIFQLYKKMDKKFIMPSIFLRTDVTLRDIALTACAEFYLQ